MHYSKESPFKYFIHSSRQFAPTLCSLAMKEMAYDKLIDVVSNPPKSIVEVTKT